jgi:hypothetical protein
MSEANDKGTSGASEKGAGCGNGEAGGPAACLEMRAKPYENVQGLDQPSVLLERAHQPQHLIPVVTNDLLVHDATELRPHLG